MFKMFDKNRIVTKSEATGELISSILMVILGFWFLLSAAGGEWLGLEAMGFKRRDIRLEGIYQAVIAIVGIFWLVISVPTLAFSTSCLRYMDIYSTRSCKLGDALAHQKNPNSSNPHNGPYQPPINNGYKPPVNNSCTPPVNNSYTPPVNNGYAPPVNNGYKPPVNNGYVPPVNNRIPTPTAKAPAEPPKNNSVWGQAGDLD